MTSFTCAGCGTTLPPPGPGLYPFKCPNACPGDDIDHVVGRAVDPGHVTFADGDAVNPFVRFRHLLSAHALALDSGMTDEEFCGLVAQLDRAIAQVDGAGFNVTPFAPVPAIGTRLEFGRGEVWVKDETRNVSGSHKARHLMGVMLYLLVDERRGGQTRNPDGRPDLAIASCGNAALGAAVVARAAGWPLDVFVPASANAVIAERLERFGARMTTCHRAEGVAGDPCYLAFREAMTQGAIPFCCQGSDNGLTIEGGETLAWEMVDAYRQAAAGRAWGGSRLDAVFVQVGGGALASSVVQGYGVAQAFGAVDRLPRFHAVQTTGAYPLKRAYDEVSERILAQIPLVMEQGFSPAADRERADLMMSHPSIIDDELRYARTHRSSFMRPWHKEPKSIAHGILDDETYDWAAIVEGMLRTGGWPVVVSEDRLLEANLLAREASGIDVDHTGSAGLAGLMKTAGTDTRLADERVAVIFSGIVRT